MTPFSLARLLKKKGLLFSILGDLPGLAGQVWILAADGSLLWGTGAQVETKRAAILLDGEPAGWVCGGSDPGLLAGLLGYAATLENEKKTLAAELLDRYRELNLLYHLSEILSGSPDPEAIVRAALAETIWIIPAEAGLILLKSEAAQALQDTISWGISYRIVPECALVTRVLASGKAELANGVPVEEYFIETGGLSISVVCAPLKTKKNNLGVILLVGPAERIFSAGELTLLNTIAQQTAPMIEVSRLHQIELEKAHYERELQMARQVQESLLPQHMPAISGWQFDRRWHPAHDVSGDFYDVIKEGPQRLGLVIADITDKGMPASLFMVFVRSALRASLTHSAPPARALINANRVICQDSFQGLFATLFYARLNTASGELSYINAGHPPALFYRRAHDDLQLLNCTGLPLGVERGAVYTQQSIQLDPGDFLLFYTDGIIEAINPAQKEFGLDRLKSEVFSRRSCSSASLLDGLEQALSTYINPLALEDDVTLMVVMRE